MLMPELPEVETVKNVLKQHLINQTIEEVIIYHEKMIKDIPVADFKKKLKNQKIIDIRRRGKYLVFHLEDYYLLSHLRMEGKFLYGKKNQHPNKHEHVVFTFDDGNALHYEDVRKFGTFHLFEKTLELESSKPFQVLGLEPFDEKFDETFVLDYIKNKKTPVKSMLLSQKMVTGLGNIYVDEVLFASRIHPQKKSNELSRDDVKNMVKYTRDILHQAILHKGTTIKTFTSTHGTSGSFQDFLQVHTKTNQPCAVCGTTIKKIKLNGRGTYFCETCQNL